MAIAVDATSSGSASATSVTVAHTCTGSNRILFVGVWIQDSGTDKISGITYNGVSMTQIGKVINAQVESVYLYYLVAPASGTNNIVMSKTGTDLGYVLGVSYTGAKQSGQPDASITNDATQETTTTTSVTTVTDNCWTLLMMKSTGTGNSAGTGTTLRLDGPGNDSTGIYDSNAAITPAGSTSLIVTGGNDFRATVMAAFSPVAGTNYPITAEAGTFTLTGIDAIVKSTRKIIASAGVFTLTGIDAVLRLGKGIIASMGSFTLTGVNAVLKFSGWVNITKNNASMSNTSKSSSSWTNLIK
jgi:hypothetical protein